MIKTKDKLFKKSSKSSIIVLASSLLMIVLVTYLYYKNYSNTFYYKKSIYLPNKIWSSDNKAKFSIDVKNSEEPFNIYLSFTHNEKYPYYNLFIKYKIYDINNKVVEEGIMEYKILDDKTGKPIGKGFWKNKTLTLLLLNKYKFPKNQKYNFHIEHMMRKDNLNGIKELTMILYR